MAANTVDYIIRLLPDTSEIKNKIKAGDLLNTSDISDIKNLIIDEVKKATAAINKEAPHMQKAIQSGLSVDTSELEKRLAFIAGLMEDLEKTKNPMEDWAKRGKGVYDTFTNLQNTVSALSGEVKGLQDSIGVLNSSFESFKSSYQSFRPTEFANVNKEMNKTITYTTRLDKTLSRMGVDNLEKIRGQLQGLYDDLTRTGKAPDFSTWSVDKLLAGAAKLDQQLDAIELKMGDRWEYTEKEILAVSRIMANQLELNKYLPKDKKILTTYQDDKGRIHSDVKDYQKQVDEAVTMVTTRLKELDDKIKTSMGESFSEIISKQLSDIKLSLTLDENKVIADINDFVKKLNAKPDSFEKIKLVPAVIDEAVNPIEDKNKRAYTSKKEYRAAQQDVVTSALLEKTGKRFDQLEKVINKKQQSILKITQDWRKEIIEAMTIGAKELDFSYDWKKQITGGGQKLYEDLQDFFYDHEIDIRINGENFVKQLQDAIQEKGLSFNTSGGTLDQSAIDALVQIARSLAVSGGVPTGNYVPSHDDTTSELDNEVKEVVENMDEVAESEQKFHKTLDESTIAIDRVIKWLYDLAKAPPSKGRDSTVGYLKGKGVDIASMTDATVSSQNIAIVQALLADNGIGDIIGNDVASGLLRKINDFKLDDISGVGKIINQLSIAIDDMLDRGGFKTSTEDETIRNKANVDAFNQVRPYGKALGMLQGVLTFFNQDGETDKLNDKVTLEQIDATTQYIMSLREKLREQKRQIEAEKEENLTRLRDRNVLLSGKTDKESVSERQKNDKQIAHWEAVNTKELDAQIAKLDSASVDGIAKRLKQQLQQRKQEIDAEIEQLEKSLLTLQKKKVKDKDLPQHQKNISDISSRLSLLNIEKQNLGQKEVELLNEDAFTAFRKAREAFTDPKNEEQREKFEDAAFQFWTQTREMYEFLRDTYGGHKWYVKAEGYQEERNVSSPKRLVSLPDDVIITSARMYEEGKINTGNGTFRNDQKTQRQLSDGKKNPNLSSKKTPSPDPTIFDTSVPDLHIKEKDRLPKNINEDRLAQDVEKLEELEVNIGKLEEKSSQLASEVDSLDNDVRQMKREVKIPSSQSLYTLQGRADTLQSAVAIAKSGLEDKKALLIPRTHLRPDEASDKVIQELNRLLGEIATDQDALDTSKADVKRYKSIQSSLPNGDLEEARKASQKLTNGKVVLNQLTKFRELSKISAKDIPLPEINKLNNLSKSLEAMGEDTQAINKLISFVQNYDYSDDQYGKKLKGALTSFSNKSQGLFDNFSAKYQGVDIESEYAKQKAYKFAMDNPTYYDEKIIAEIKKQEKLNKNLTSKQGGAEKLIAELQKHTEAASAEQQQEVQKIAAQLREVRASLYDEAKSYIKILNDQNADQHTKDIASAQLQQTLQGLKTVQNSYVKFANRGADKLYSTPSHEKNVKSWIKKYLDGQPDILGEKEKELQEKRAELQSTRTAKQGAEDRLHSIVSDQDTVAEFKKRKEFVDKYNELVQKEKELLAKIAEKEQSNSSHKQLDKQLTSTQNKIDTLLTKTYSEDRFQAGLDQVVTYDSVISALEEQSKNIRGKQYLLDKQDADLNAYPNFSQGEAGKALNKYKFSLYKQVRDAMYKQIAEKYKQYPATVENYDALMAAKSSEYDLAESKAKSFRDNLRVKDGEFDTSKIDKDILQYAIQIDDSTTKTVGEIIGANLKENLRNYLAIDSRRQALEERAKPIDDKLAKAKALRERARTYGQVDEASVKNVDLEHEKIKAQKQIESLKADNELAKKQQAALESDKEYSQIRQQIDNIKKRTSELTKEIAKYKKDVDNPESKARIDELTAEKETLQSQRKGLEKQKPYHDIDKKIKENLRKQADRELKIQEYENDLVDIDKLMQQRQSGAGSQKQGSDANERLEKTTQALTEKKAKLVEVEKELVQLRKDYNATTEGTDEREAAQYALTKKLTEKASLEKQVKRQEKNVAKWERRVAKEEIVATDEKRKDTSTSDDGAKQSDPKITGAIKTALSGNVIDINTDGLATEETLSAILQLLTNGNYQAPSIESAPNDDSAEAKAIMEAVSKLGGKLDSVNNRVDDLEGGKSSKTKTGELPPALQSAQKARAQYDSLQDGLIPKEYSNLYIKLQDATAKAEAAIEKGRKPNSKNLENIQKTSDKMLEFGQKVKEANGEFDKLNNKVQQYKTIISDAKTNGYLLEDGDKSFVAANKNLEETIQIVKDGKASFEELGKAYRDALGAGSSTNKQINANKRLYAGTNEVNAVKRQRDKMIGSGVDLGDESDIQLVRDYDNAYQKLIKDFDTYAQKHQLSDPKIQESLRQQAAGVQKLGRQLMSATTEAEKLKEAADNSGSFVKNGQTVEMGGFKAFSDQEMQNKAAAMRAYAVAMYGAEAESFKLDKKTMTLSGTIRENDRVVHDVAVKFNEAAGGAYAFAKAERESLSGIPAFIHGFKEKLKAISQYLASMTSIYQIFGQLRKGIQYIREIDAALVELRKVTNETEEAYDEFLKTAAKTADRLGSTISGVTEATATFAKLGYSMKMATEMAESAIVYKNVGDGIASTEDAANSIISTLKGFRLEASESMRIVDRFNEVGNRFAITSQGLGEALRLSASALNEGGNTLDESIGIITAANEVVNDPSSVGTALKTLTLRLRGSKTELEEMGEDVSDMATTTSQLQAKLLALTGGKVDIMLDENTFKSSTQILREMAAAWEDMSDLSRASALELMGGKRQANVLSALITNFDTAEKAIEASAKSAGSAIRENEVYLDSIQGKLDQFTNAVQTMWTNALDSDVVKDIVSIGTWLIKAIDKIGLFKSLLIGLAGYSMIKNKMGPIAFFKGIIESGTKGINKLTDYAKGLKNVSFATSELSNAKATLTQTQLKEKLTNTGLTDSVAEEIVAKTNLGKATDELSASTLDATLKEAGYSKEKRESIIQSVFDTAATKANSDANMENAASNVVAGAAEDKETQDTIENTGATIADTVATNANSDANMKNAKSNIKLGDSLKSIGTSFKGFLKDNAITLAITAAVGIIVGAVSFINRFTTTVDELKEEFDEAANKVESLNTELQNLESQLENINDQIAELSAKTPLSFTDQEELSRLQAQSAELQRQIDLNETLKEQRAIEANALAMEMADTYNDIGATTGQTTEENAGTGAKWGAIGVGTAGALGGAAVGAKFGMLGAAAGPVGAAVGIIAGALIGAVVGAISGGAVGAIGSTHEDKVGDKIDNMKEELTTLQEKYNDAREAYMDDPSDKGKKKKFEKAQEKLNDYKSDMSEYMTELDVYYQTIRDNWDVATEDQRQAAIEWADKMDAYAIASGGQNAKENAINQVFTDGALIGKFEKEKKAIDRYVKALENGDESAAQSIANVINSNQELKDAFSAKTLDPQDAIDYFTKIGQEANFATLEGKAEEIRKATEKIGNAFNNFGQFMDGDSVDKVKIAEYFKGTSEATRAEIARLVKEINDGEISVENALKQFELFGIQSAIDIHITDVQTDFKDVFVDLEDADGLINTFKELGEAIGSTADALKVFNKAEGEMAYSGRVSIETALQLMEYTDDYGSVLQVVDGKLQLVDGAEEALIQTRIDAIKTSAQASLSDATNAYHKAQLATQTYKDALTTDMSAQVVAKSWEKVLAGAAGLWEGIKSLLTDESWTDAYNRAYNTTLSNMTGYETEYTDSGLQALVDAENDAKEAMDAAANNLELANQLTPENLESMYNADDVEDKEDAANKAFQEKMDYWENRIGANQAKYEQIQNEIDLLEAKGKRAGEAYYKKQIELENERKSLLEQQKAEALKYLGALKEGSDEWWEVANTINDIEGELDDVIASVQELSDAIGQIRWDGFEELHDRFSNLTTDLENIRDILSNEDMFDNEGNFTKEGVANLATYIQELEIYKNALANVQKELADFQKGYKGNEGYFASIGIDSEQDYYDKLVELTDKQDEYTKAIKDSEQSVVEMYENQIDAIEEYIGELIDGYNDYIDAVKESLDAERDLYDFKKNVQKQNKDITSLERRIASLSGSTNASDIAERRKLQAELNEAREGLNDTYYERAKDQQSQALDDEAQAYEESMNKYVESLRTMLEEAQKDMETFLSSITNVVVQNAGSVEEVFNDTGLAVDSAIVDPWTKAAEAMTGYEEDALVRMNDWTKAGESGYFYNFNTNATSQLTSPWSAGTTAANNFVTSVKTAMGEIYKSVQSNVDNSTAKLNTLANVIKDTEVKPSSSGDNSGKTNTTNTNNTTTKSSSGVAALQEVLNTVFSAGLTVDGKLGPATTSALKKAQSKVGVSSDGKYGTQTRNAIIKYIDKQIASWKAYSGSSSMVGQGIRAFTNAKSQLPLQLAKGTMRLEEDRLAVTDESWIGEEITLAAGKNGQLQYLKKGSAVMPADISANLIEWGKLNPNMLNVGGGANINMISNAINKPEINLDIAEFLHVDKVDKDTMPELERFVDKKMNELVRQLNYSIKKFK